MTASAAPTFLRDPGYSLSSRTARLASITPKRNTLDEDYKTSRALSGSRSMVFWGPKGGPLHQIETNVDALNRKTPDGNRGFKQIEYAELKQPYPEKEPGTFNSPLSP